jgi:putative ABC transport system permease protein
MEVIHLNWKDGVRLPGKQTPAHELAALDLTPRSITAFLVGLKSKMATFHVQRHVNHYQKEPLLAILPGIALTELWQMMKVMENTLRLISILVLFSSLLGLSTMLLASIRERQREIAIMRAIGASPFFVFLTIQTEALLISLTGIMAAIFALVIGIFFAQPFLADNYGILINHFAINSQMLGMLGVIVMGTLLLGLIPAFSAYRLSLHHGLGMKS